MGLAAEVARNWIEGDTAGEILSAIIVENGTRRAMALEIFKERTIRCKPGAPYLWLKLPEHWQPGDFARAAQDRGVRVTSGTAFAIDRRADDQGVRACFGGNVSRDGLRRALVALDALIDELPGDELHSVA